MRAGRWPQASPPNHPNGFGHNFPPSAPHERIVDLLCAPHWVGTTTTPHSTAGLPTYHPTSLPPHSLTSLLSLYSELFWLYGSSSLDSSDSCVCVCVCDESGQIDFEEFVRSLNSLVGSFDQQLEFLFSLVSSIRLVHMFDHSSPARPRP